MRGEEDLGTWVHVQAGPHCTTKSAYPHLHLSGHRHTHLYQSLPASCLPITKSPKPGACSNVQVQKAQWYCYLIAVRYTAASPFIYMKHSLRLEYKQLPHGLPSSQSKLSTPIICLLMVLSYSPVCHQMTSCVDPTQACCHSNSPQSRYNHTPSSSTDRRPSCCHSSRNL